MINSILFNEYALQNLYFMLLFVFSIALSLSSQGAYCTSFKKALYLSVNVFSTKVLIAGQSNLVPRAFPSKNEGNALGTRLWAKVVPSFLICFETSRSWSALLTELIMPRSVIYFTHLLCLLAFILQTWWETNNWLTNNQQCVNLFHIDCVQYLNNKSVFFFSSALHFRATYFAVFTQSLRCKMVNEKWNLIDRFYCSRFSRLFYSFY